jgi:hypothetical protein
MIKTGWVRVVVSGLVFGVGIAGAPRLGRAAESFQCGVGGKANIAAAKCECPAGKVEVSEGKVSKCVPAPVTKPKDPVKPKDKPPEPTPTCAPGLEFKEGKGCVPKVETTCPSGMHFEDGKGCVANVADTTCPTGQHFETGKGCVGDVAVGPPVVLPPQPPPNTCGPGTHEELGKGCVPDAAAAPVTTGVAGTGAATTGGATPGATAATPNASELEPKRDGFVLGARLGYATPMGDEGGGTKLGDDYGGGVLLGLDVGYRFLQYIYVGGFLDYASISTKSQSDTGEGPGCPSGVTCSASIFRYGLMARIHPINTGTIDPWFGLGFGRETLSTDFSAGGFSANGTATGWEYLHLQAGVDFLFAQRFGVGPFLAYSFGSYDKVKTTDIHGNTETKEIASKGTHGWLVFGVRGTFTL